MKIDVPDAIGAVAREVRSTEHEGKPARVVVAMRSYGTAIEDLWNALTDAERIPRWFLPISGDLRLGGRYQLEGNAGGEITRCEPPHVLSLTWEMGPQKSWLTVSLSPAGPERTRLELEHMSHIEGDFWDTYGPGAVGVGWDGALMGLAQHVASGQAVDRAESAAWMASGEGKSFYRLSSERWGAASIAAGADPAAARAAAARTAAFYTGEPAG